MPKRTPRSRTFTIRITDEHTGDTQTYYIASPDRLTAMVAAVQLQTLDLTHGENV